MLIRKNKQKRLTALLIPRFFIGAGAALLFFIVLGIAKGTIKNYQVRQDIEGMKSEIASLESQNEEFTQLIHYLKSDDFVEQEAKLKLGLKYKGEGVVVIPDADPGTVPVRAEVGDDRANPSKWWDYFFNN